MAAFFKRLSLQYYNKKAPTIVGAYYTVYSRRDLNPHGHYCPLDFKSSVSTNFTTRAYGSV